MACSGCQNRADALRKMQEAAKRRDAAQVVRMGSYVVRSGIRDMKRVISHASVFRTSRKP